MKWNISDNSRCWRYDSDGVSARIDVDESEIYWTVEFHVGQCPVDFGKAESVDEALLRAECALSYRARGFLHDAKCMAESMEKILEEVENG